MLSVHVPADNDEWLKHETEKLTQFTRLFPLPPQSQYMSAVYADGDAMVPTIDGTKQDEMMMIPSDLNEDHECNVEEDDDDDKDDKHAAGSQPLDSNGSVIATARKQIKSASYEDIIFQVYDDDEADDDDDHDHDDDDDDDDSMIILY